MYYIPYYVALCIYIFLTLHYVNAIYNTLHYVNVIYIMSMQLFNIHHGYEGVNSHSVYIHGNKYLLIP